ncbi:MAG: hypothetical protein PW788_07715 [Micavibrio sp.]|nr:hypothetical protein [Micavibrio sp.]
MAQMTTDSNGTVRWFEDGQPHRDDGPAYEAVNGDKFWFSRGQLHRDDGPAMERSDGSRFWHRHGQRHREDGPSEEHASGEKCWYRNDRLHREDGPAIEMPDGSTSWYLYGVAWPEGPAVVARRAADAEENLRQKALQADINRDITLQRHIKPLKAVRFKP